MIDRIRMENFQSHAKSDITLCGGVNTFIGTSDHGKSSIMRGLALVVDNKPEGNEFISHWAFNKKGKVESDTIVSLTLDDGQEVTRIKGTDNYYQITDEQGEVQDFRAMGKSVPEEISALLNLSDTNIQRQEENFFLFAETAGEVLRRINSYTRLDLIDTSLSQADKDMRESRSALRVAKAQIEELVDRLKPFQILPSLEAEYQRGVAFKDELAELTTRQKKIESLVSQYRRVFDGYSQFANLERASRKLKKAEENIHAKMQEVEKGRTVSANLSRVVRKYKSVKDEMVKAIPDVDFTPVLKNIQELDEARKRTRSLGRIIETWKSRQREMESTANVITKLHDDYHNALGDTCPLCGAPVKEAGL